MARRVQSLEDGRIRGTLLMHGGTRCEPVDEDDGIRVPKHDRHPLAG